MTTALRGHDLAVEAIKEALADFDDRADWPLTIRYLLSFASKRP